MTGLLHPDPGNPSYLRTLLALHAALEPAEAAILGYESGTGRPVLPYFPRVPQLARELADLGAEPGKGPSLALPAPEDLPSCLGYRYVLEGSALGSAAILQRVTRAGWGPGGLDYLRCQAQRAGNWPRFTVALNASLAAESDRLLAAKAARSLFEYFCRSLDAFTESHEPFVPR